MLDPKVAAHIRSIFLHNGEPVPVDEAAVLLGWDLPTMDEAIKWKAIRLDDGSTERPQIARRELLEQALEQWPLSDIAKALGSKDATRILGRKRSRDRRLVINDLDTARAAALRTLDPDQSVLLLPRAREAAMRRITKARAAAGAATAQFKRRPRRTDDVRAFTLSAFEVGYKNLVPMLRLRGRWLARLGFKPGMRVYIATEPGKLVMTVTDPATDVLHAVAAPRLQLVANQS